MVRRHIEFLSEDLSDVRYGVAAIGKRPDAGSLRVEHVHPVSTRGDNDGFIVEKSGGGIRLVERDTCGHKGIAD